MSLVAVALDSKPSLVDVRPDPSLAGSLLREGPQVTLIDDGQLDVLQEFLLRLDRESRCRRFGHAASDDALTAHAQTALSEATCVIGVAVDGTLRGILEIYSCAPRPFCEAALVVEPAWRRRGLGFAMLRAAARFSCARGAGGIRLIFTRDNWPMRKLADKAHARFDLVLDEICAEIAPARLGGTA
jgi:ribosomal protein S18 acetylase RimI-like enzyme